MPSQQQQYVAELLRLVQDEVIHRDGGRDDARREPHIVEVAVQILRREMRGGCLVSEYVRDVTLFERAKASTGHNGCVAPIFL